MQQTVISKITAWVKRRKKKITSFELTAVMEDGSRETISVSNVSDNDTVKSGTRILKMKLYEIGAILNRPIRLRGIPHIYRVSGLMPERGFEYRLVVDYANRPFVLKTPSEYYDSDNSKQLKIDISIQGSEWLVDGFHQYGKAYSTELLGVEKVSVRGSLDRLKPGVYLFPFQLPGGSVKMVNDKICFDKGEVYFGGV